MRVSGAAVFVERSDPIRANAQPRCRASLRGELNADASISRAQQRGGPEPTYEARAGAGQAAQRLVLEAPDRRRIGRGNAKIDEDPDRASADRGAGRQDRSQDHPHRSWRSTRRSARPGGWRPASPTSFRRFRVTARFPSL